MKFGVYEALKNMNRYSLEQDDKCKTCSKEIENNFFNKCFVCNDTFCEACYISIKVSYRRKNKIIEENEICCKKCRGNENFNCTGNNWLIQY